MANLVNVLIVVFLFNCVICRADVYEKNDCISFSDINSKCSKWYVNSNGVDFKIDSCDNKISTAGLIISNYIYKFNGRRLKQTFYSFLIQQSISISNTDSVCLYFDYKGIFKSNLWLTLICKNKFDSIVSVDSVSIVKTNSLSRFAKTINVTNSDELIIQLSSKGNLLVDDSLSIYFNDINTISFGKTEYKVKRYESFKCEKDVDFSKSNALVYGIGESVHGSATIQNYSFLYMKFLIETRSVKTVCLELPSILVLIWNAYILGYVDVDIEQLTKDYKTYSSCNIYNFLQWLRQYNKGAKSKINISGIDINNNLSLNRLILCDYFRSRICDKVLVDNIVKLILKDDLSVNSEFYNTLQYNQRLRVLLTNYEIFQLLTYIELLSEIKKDRDWMIKRDFYMYKLYNSFINNSLSPSEKVVIYAHFAHINTKNVFYPSASSVSLGNYLKFKYGNEYYSQGIFVCKGFVTNVSKDYVFSTQELSYPIENSLEYVCLNLNQEGNVLDSRDFTENLFVRIEGTPFKGCNDYFMVNIHRRIDSIVYFKDSQGFDVPNSWNQKDLIYKKLYTLLRQHNE